MARRRQGRPAEEKWLEIGLWLDLINVSNSAIWLPILCQMAELLTLMKSSQTYP